MLDFRQELNARLTAIREQGLYRELRRVDSPQSPRLEIDGKAFLNFSSNDYLGLANDPRVKEAAIKAIEKYGAGAGASRLICGSLAPHHELETALAAFHGTEAALSFSSGYVTALGAITALLSQADIIVLDKLVHASLVDAAKLSGAKLRVFAHNDLNDLERILKWADQRNGKARASLAPRTLIVTESVFSMDGDHAPLRDLAELKEKHGAWLMVDEAHATGLYGPNRRGLAEEFDVGERIEIKMGTLGKALGAAGGYICGSRALIEYVVNRARSFIFSTAPVPAAASAARAGIQFVASSEGEGRCRQLWERVAQLAGAEDFFLEHRPCPTPHGVQEGPATPDSFVQRRPSAIIPIWAGAEAKALEMAAALRTAGIFLPAIRYPTVRRGQARLRLTVTASHSAEDVSTLLGALTRLRSGDWPNQTEKDVNVSPAREVGEAIPILFRDAGGKKFQT